VVTHGKLESIVLVPQEGYAGKMSKPHKVFGIGLNKTGTSSLKSALVTLGYNHCTLRGQMTHKFFNNNEPNAIDVFQQGLRFIATKRDGIALLKGRRYNC